MRISFKSFSVLARSSLLSSLSVSYLYFFFVASSSSFVAFPNNSRASHSFLPPSHSVHFTFCCKRFASCSASFIYCSKLFAFSSCTVLFAHNLYLV